MCTVHTNVPEMYERMYGTDKTDHRLCLSKIKQTTFISTTGIIIKTLLLLILGLLNYGIYSLIISEIINIIYVTILSIIILIRIINDI